MSERPTIAACLIVRNEAAALSACLESLQNHVDAIYVTDTGSTDDSPAIARSFGAEVSFIPWNDNFASARNASIAAAKEDWILTIDADDRLPAGEADKLREQLAEDACAATVNYQVNRDYTPVRAIKLLRNRQGAQFEGLIHENVCRWLAAREACGWRRQALNITVLHEGYTAAALPFKVARNLPLLEAEWKRSGELKIPGHSLHVGAELGLALAHANRLEEGADFLTALLNDEMTGGFNPSLSSSLQILINLLWVFDQMGRSSDRLLVVRSVEAFFDRSPVYQLHRGLVELASANFKSAREWLERFHDRWSKDGLDVAIPVEYLGAGLWRDLGICHMAERQYKAAETCFQRCLELDPGNHEYQLRLKVACGIIA